MTGAEQARALLAEARALANDKNLAAGQVFHAVVRAESAVADALSAAEAALREAREALRLGERLRQLRRAEANWPGCDGADADPEEHLNISAEADDVEEQYESALDAVLARAGEGA